MQLLSLIHPSGVFILRLKYIDLDLDQLTERKRKQIKIRPNIVFLNGFLGGPRRVTA